MKRLFQLLIGSMLVTNLCLAQESSWQTIQSHIFQGNCVSCHSEGTSFARQSDLVLSDDRAYSELVGVLPNNSTARADGLMRVSPTGGPIGLFQSFLWEKINAADQDHFYDDHPGYGALMPLGAPSLTNGQLEFVKTWIMEGAPQTGSVVDVSVLDDTSRFEPPEFRVLDPPQNGIQLHLGPFDIWPSEKHDREFLYYQPYETETDQLVSRYEISYRPGSHHFILYNYEQGESTPQPEVYRDIRNQNGRVDLRTAFEIGGLFPFQFFIGSQAPYTNFSFPPGVALRLPAGQGFDLNSHSVNRGTESQVGEVYVNMHMSDPEDIIHVADYGSFSNGDLHLPPQQETVVSRTFRFDETQHVMQMFSHAHEHMTEFRVEHVGGERDGELIYWTNDWEHPPSLEFETPLTFERGDRVRLVTTYYNDTDDEIEFGLLSSDEMQILFYIYYTGSNALGDFVPDGTLDAADIDRLSGRIHVGSNNIAFDLNDDAKLDQADRRVLVEELMNTYFGDSNLDGEFNTKDLVDAFQVGEYEDAIAGNSTWADGDWDGDGDFGTADLVLAFQSGGFEKGKRQATQEVPEPNSPMALFAVAISIYWRRRFAKRDRK